MAQVLIKDDNTTVFFLCSNNVDVNGINDAHYGYLRFLLESKIPPDRLHIFVNTSHPQCDNFYQGINMVTPLTIHSANEVFDEIGKVKTKNLIIITSGHGGPYGLETLNSTIFNPQSFKQAMSKNHITKHFIYIWGPCYTGVFKTLSDKERVIQIGAADLVSSLSCESPQNMRNFVNWPVNIFLYFGYEWLFDKKNTQSKDLDGDGASTLFDFYNYAASTSHGYLLNERAKLTQHILKVTLEKEKIPKEKDLINQKLLDPKLSLDEKSSLNEQLGNLILREAAIPPEVEQSSQVLYNEQIPWCHEYEQLFRVKFELSPSPPNLSKIIRRT